MANPFYDGKDWFYSEASGKISHIHGSGLSYLEWITYASNSNNVRFATEAEAKTYKANYEAEHGKPGKTVGSGPLTVKDPLAAVTPDFGVSDVPGALAKIGAAMTAFLSALSDASMWRSVGWVLLGVIVIGLALYIWTKKVQAGTA